MRRLRIAIVAASYPNDLDPIRGIFVRDQAAILAERHDVVVIAPRIATISRRPSTWSTLASALRQRRVAPAGIDGPIPTARPLAFHVYRAPGFSSRSYGGAIIAGCRALRGWERPDLIHAHVVLPAGHAAVGLGHAWGIPVVLTEHSGPFSAHLRTDRDRRDVKETLCGADRVIAVGPGLREEMLRVAPVRIDVVGNVVAPAFFAYPPHPVRSPDPARPLRLLGVGFLTREKRFDLLLEAVAMLGERVGPVEVVIVGDGPEAGGLVSQAAALGLADRVRFVAMGPRDAMLPWLAWCDALVSTSDHESFGLVVAEALATGRPVVATASGGPDSFVTPEIGVVVPRGDVAALAASIAGLPAFLGRFDPGQARRAMAARFGPDVFLDRMDGIYADVIEAGGGRRASPPPTGAGSSP